ncbi:N-alpha-acetyltransferase 40 [Desmophyllum pertusum]|uniref:N-alpha-acetyltransferase 40 n=1 Tax=Desmophyllum pertusum TaxID=174260 RepID=A0A9W9YSG7_9CNID|nr:N-alpha-acetyltransferase 40 [Desmophyllum pertusum]
MGKKSAKGKEKKLKRKEEMAKVSAAQAVVDVANEVKDPLAPLTAFRSFKRNELDLHLECQRVTDMSAKDIDWAFDLTKHNMQLLYENSPWGWNDKKKKDEMTEDKAWYLMAKDESAKAVAFSHFRFDLEEGDEVLYCYEVQVESEARGKGLGKFFMQILAMMAHRAQMKKVMLTVLKDNERAINFFTNIMKFQTDETSPAIWDPMNPEDYCYDILSKVLVRKTPASNETDDKE